MSVNDFEGNVLKINDFIRVVESFVVDDVNIEKDRILNIKGLNTQHNQVEVNTIPGNSSNGQIVFKGNKVIKCVYKYLKFKHDGEVYEFHLNGNTSRKHGGFKIKEMVARNDSLIIVRAEREIRVGMNTVISYEYV